MTEITRGRQYELDTNPDDGPQFVEDRPKLFNLMIRRPGSRDIYLSPTFDDLAEYARRPFFEGDDERENRDTDWSLTLPHHCGEWPIGTGSLDEVLADAERLRDELDQAIDALRAEIPQPEGPRWHYTITPVAEPGEIEPTAPWPPEGTVGVQVYMGDPPRPIREYGHNETPLLPSGMGEILHGLLNPQPQSGPPWTHNFQPPEPVEDENGEWYIPLGPTHTITFDADEAPDV